MDTNVAARTEADFGNLGDDRAETFRQRDAPSPSRCRCAAPSGHRSCPLQNGKVSRLIGQQPPSILERIRLAGMSQLVDE